MIKLIIQIPCFNEEASLPITLKDLPRSVPGFDVVEWLVIDDGSRDNTISVAERMGVDHIVSLPFNRGLAHAFSAGIEACLNLGADAIVNTDADNQYCADDIPAITKPVLDREADMVIGARPIASIAHFSKTKKFLQFLGSTVVRQISNADVGDAPSGFRCFSREFALRLKVFNNYTYTMETIVQASQNGFRIKSVPIRVNGDLRESRLVKSIPRYIAASLLTVLRIYLLYKPLKAFSIVALVPLMIGVFLTSRWLYLNWFEFQITGRLHIPSLIVSVLFLAVGSALLLAGVLADLISANRRLLEEIRFDLRAQRFQSEKPLPFLRANLRARLSSEREFEHS